MPKAWTGEVVGKMHVNRITNRQLADQLGVTDRYVSMVLNGEREPDGMQERMEAAVEQIIEARKEKNHDE